MVLLDVHLKDPALHLLTWLHYIVRVIHPVPRQLREVDHALHVDIAQSFSTLALRVARKLALLLRRHLRAAASRFIAPQAPCSLPSGEAMEMKAPKLVVFFTTPETTSPSFRLVASSCMTTACSLMMICRFGMLTCPQVSAV